MYYVYTASVGDFLRPWIPFWYSCATDGTSSPHVAPAWCVCIYMYVCIYIYTYIYTYVCVSVCITIVRRTGFHLRILPLSGVFLFFKCALSDGILIPLREERGTCAPHFFTSVCEHWLVYLGFGLCACIFTHAYAGVCVCMHTHTFAHPPTPTHTHTCTHPHLAFY